VYTGSFGDTDGFLLKLNAAGAGTIYSTYLGGARVDYAASVTLDSANSVYVSASLAATGFRQPPGISNNPEGCDRLFRDQVQCLRDFSGYSPTSVELT